MKKKLSEKEKEKDQSDDVFLWKFLGKTPVGLCLDEVKKCAYVRMMNRRNKNVDC